MKACRGNCATGANLSYVKLDPLTQGPVLGSHSICCSSNLNWIAIRRQMALKHRNKYIIQHAERSRGGGEGCICPLKKVLNDGKCALNRSRGTRASKLGVMGTFPGGDDQSMIKKIAIFNVEGVCTYTICRKTFIANKNWSILHLTFERICRFFSDWLDI